MSKRVLLGSNSRRKGQGGGFHHPCPSQTFYRGLDTLKRQLKEIAELTKPLTGDGDPFIRLEALKLLASLNGILVAPETRVTDPKAQYAVRAAQETIMGRVWQKAEGKRKANRKFYLKTRIRELEADGSNPQLLTQFKAELATAPKRIVGGTESTQDASEPVATVKDTEALQKARENALAYLAGMAKEQSEE